MVRQLLTVLLACTAISISSGAQDYPSIAISIFAARQPDSPLRVSAFSSGSNIPMGGRSMVRNVSPKPISGFMLTALVGAGCPKDGSHHTIEVGRRFEWISVSPYSTAQSMETILDPGVLVTLARQFNATYLHVEVAVAEVRFQDDSVWKGKSPLLFDDSFLEADAPHCAKWQTPTSVLTDITTTVYSDAPGQLHVRARLTPQRNGALGYVMTCDIRGTKVYCPKN